MGGQRRAPASLSQLDLWKDVPGGIIADGQVRRWPRATTGTTVHRRSQAQAPLIVVTGTNAGAAGADGGRVVGAGGDASTLQKRNYWEHLIRDERSLERIRE